MNNIDNIILCYIRWNNIGATGAGSIGNALANLKKLTSLTISLL